MSHEYTAVCIGGSQDGRIVTSKERRLYFPVHEQKSLLVPVDDYMQMPIVRQESYRTEEFAFPDGGNRATLLIHDDVSIREAFYQLLDCYSGHHTPAHSDRKESRKADPSEVDSLASQLRIRNTIIDCQQQIIRDLRLRIGE